MCFLGLFGEEDKNPSPDDVRKFEALLKQHNQNVEVVIYPNAGHAFHADYRQSTRGSQRRLDALCGMVQALF